MTRSVLIRAGLAGAAAGLLCWLVGVQGARPVLIGCCVALGVAVVTSSPTGWYGSWPTRPEPVPGGGSSQVWRLANRLRTLDSGKPASDPALQHRLRRLATARLHRLGVDWSDPRAVRALGPGVHAALAGDTFRPGLRDVERIVVAIESLERLDDADESRPDDPGGART